MNRTPGIVILLRFYAFCFVFVGGIALVLNWASHNTMFELWLVPIVSGTIMLMLMLIGGTTVKAGSAIIYHGDPRYEKWRAEGGRPYLDSLPPPINPDTWETRGFVNPDPRRNRGHGVAG